MLTRKEFNRLSGNGARPISAITTRGILSTRFHWIEAGTKVLVLSYTKDSDSRKGYSIYFAANDVFIRYVGRDALTEASEL